MKIYKLGLLLVSLLLCSNSFGQRDKELERKIIERKVDTTFTVEEAAENFLLFYNNMKLMKMNDELENEYSNIVLNSAARMRRLDDNDKDYTIEERKELFEEMLDKLSADLKKILSKEQFKLHEKNFNVILKRFYERAHWAWKRD
ncbi:hypothetical protein [Winogradskyella sp. A2]|uniref:hypothetical protein n=1 Tax=Winogradskyella sp. A2 TaxID=3366944 RepID=UPI00398C6581